MHNNQGIRCILRRRQIKAGNYFHCKEALTRPFEAITYPGYPGMIKRKNARKLYNVGVGRTSVTCKHAEKQPSKF
jgi:hypothetical protein